MIQIFRLLAGMLLAAVLAACGGGGGSSGSTGTGGTGGTGTTPGTPTLTLTVVNSADVAVAGNTISSSTAVFARAVVKDATGAAVANKLVSFTASAALVLFQPSSGAVLTDANGVAKVQLTPASSTASGAGTLTASSSVPVSGVDTAVTASVDIQVLPSSAPLTPTLTLALVNSAGAAIPDNSVTNGSVVFAKATVKDAAGALVPNKLVVFSSGSGVVGFQPQSGQVLTDSTGVAKVQLIPTSLTASGAETLNAATTVGSTNLSASIDIQTSSANVTLTNFTSSLSTMSAFQSTPVSVDVNVNGSLATSTPVQVTFTANCGAFNPASVTSNSSGKAVSTFQATGCSAGTATLSATAVGVAAAATRAITIQAASPTNLLFVSATPSTIFTLQAAFGVKQSTVKFKVVDASGNGVGPSTNVVVELSASAIASGVTFADTGTTASKIVSTDVNGEVSVIVKAGTVPTPLSVNAHLQSLPGITASSAGLSVNSGQPVQNFFSISASTFNPEGWRYDGELVTLTVLVADRLGQPVPAGTPITFITEGGQVTASCFVAIDVNNKSGCSVSLVTQDFRPTNGRVTVLAYTEGEEPFIDANGNNKYDLGETFYDMGQPFLDSNENLVWDSVPAEQKVGDSTTPGAGIGSAACAAHPFLVSNVANTCNGSWGSVRVRQQLVLSFSDSFAVAPTFFAVSTSGVSLNLEDINGNSLPFGTSVTATISGGTNCTVNEVVPASVPSTTNPTIHRVIISKGSAPGDTCSGAEVTIKSTTLKGNATLLGTVMIP
jgi:hypothetical protein